MQTNTIIVLKKMKGNYWPGESNDRTLSALAWMFEEGNSFLKKMKQKIFSDETKAEYTSNATRIQRTDNNIVIEPSYGDDNEDYRIELSREALFKLINEWEALIQKQPNEIIITKDEHGVITLEGVFK